MNIFGNAGFTITSEINRSLFDNFAKDALTRSKSNPQCSSDVW